MGQSCSQGTSDFVWRHFWLLHFGGVGTGRGVTTGSWRVRTGRLPNVHMPTPARTTKNDLENVDSVLVEKLLKNNL